MPSSIPRGYGLGQQAVQLPYLPSYAPDQPLIGPLSMQAIGEEAIAHVASIGTAIAYPAANRALGYQFVIGDPYLVRKVWWFNGLTAATDNADVAVYNEAGTTLLVSAGATLIATASIVQEVDVTDTLLTPGRYWCVYNQNGTTASPRTLSTTVMALRASGCAQFAGAVPLGATFTPAAIVGTTIPFFGIANRLQVA